MLGGRGEWEQVELLAEPVVLLHDQSIQLLGGGGYTAFCPGACFCLENVQWMVGSGVIWVSELGASVLNLVRLLHESASAMLLLAPCM